eukprot:scaffold266_cov248-Pinguiococcus_pyrenoidosus.AAC.8
MECRLLSRSPQKTMCRTLYSPLLRPKPLGRSSLLELESAKDASPKKMGSPWSIRLRAASTFAASEGTSASCLRRPFVLSIPGFLALLKCIFQLLLPALQIRLLEIRELEDLGFLVGFRLGRLRRRNELSDAGVGFGSIQLNLALRQLDFFRSLLVAPLEISDPRLCVGNARGLLPNAGLQEDVALEHSCGGSLDFVVQARKGAFAQGQLPGCGFLLRLGLATSRLRALQGRLELMEMALVSQRFFAKVVLPLPEALHLALQGVTLGHRRSFPLGEPLHLRLEIRATLQGTGEEILLVRAIDVQKRRQRLLFVENTEVVKLADQKLLPPLAEQAPRQEAPRSPSALAVAKQSTLHGFLPQQAGPRTEGQVENSKWRRGAQTPRLYGASYPPASVEGASHASAQGFPPRVPQRVARSLPAPPAKPSVHHFAPKPSVQRAAAKVPGIRRQLRIAQTVRSGMPEQGEQSLSPAGNAAPGQEVRLLQTGEVEAERFLGPAFLNSEDARCASPLHEAAAQLLREEHGQHSVEEGFKLRVHTGRAPYHIESKAKLSILQTHHRPLLAPEQAVLLHCRQPVEGRPYQRPQQLSRCVLRPPASKPACSRSTRRALCQRRRPLLLHFSKLLDALAEGAELGARPELKRHQALAHSLLRRHATPSRVLLPRFEDPPLQAPLLRVPRETSDFPLHAGFAVQGNKSGVAPS